MAVGEAQLVRDGVKFVNKALVQFVPGRSLEAIKGKRRQAAYKALVQTKLTERAQGSNMQDGLPPTSCVPRWMSKVPEMRWPLPQERRGSWFPRPVRRLARLTQLT